MKTVKILGFILLSLFLGIAIGYFLHTSNQTSEIKLPEEVTRISKDIRVTVMESNSENRTQYLNLSYWYCRATVLQGGSNPEQRDLADPNASIVFFFLEDIADSTKADNYGDLIIRMNPIVENGTRRMVLVFYAEGAYDKFVYYKDQLLHHYNDSDPTSNYGISVIDISQT